MIDGNTLHGAKIDHRKPRGGWADGNYMNSCLDCGDDFIGDKRAVQCADCAYKQSREPVSLKRFVSLPELRNKLSPVSNLVEILEDITITAPAKKHLILRNEVKKVKEFLKEVEAN